MRTGRLTLSSAALCLAVHGPAIAQDAPSPGTSVSATTASSSEGVNAGDIIVTARKRQESLLKVPVIENVLTSQTLERQQITDVFHIVTQVPGLALGTSVVTIGAQVSLRGIGTTTLDAGVDQSVSLNIDGVQLSQGVAYKSGSFDLAQVEVLKGPQALFYGKNSPGGVIAFRTADPGDKTEIIIRSGYEFEARNWRSEAILSGPVTPTLGLRLAALYADGDGYYRNLATPNLALGGAPTPGRIGGVKSIIVRGTAVWKPSAEFSARLKLNYTRDREHGGAVGQYQYCPDGTGAVAPFPNIAFLAGEDCRVDRNVRIAYFDPVKAFPQVSNDGKLFQNDDQRFGVLDLTWRPTPDMSVTSTTGYYKLHSRGLINGTIQPSIPDLASDNELHRRDFTEELRLNSDFSGPLNFTAGAYYQDGKLTNHLIVQTNRVLPAEAFFPATLANQQSTIQIRTLSAFAQVRWKPAPKLEISPGVRWTDEQRSNVVYLLPSFALLPILTPKITSVNWSPEFTVTYTPTDELTVYGSYKKGFKSGSFAVSRIFVPPANNAFGDESVQGGEGGVKARLLDRTVFVNLAGYYYIYKGLQVGLSRNEGALPINETINAGKARVYGVDFDITYNPRSLPGLALHAAANWNHARFASLEGVTCNGGQTIAAGCNEVPVTNPITGVTAFTGQSLTGQPLVKAPDWQVTAGGEYDMPLGRYGLSFGADGQYSSKFATQLSSLHTSDQPSYFKLNANITLRGPDDHWELALIGNNLTKKITYSNCVFANYQNGGLFGGEISGTNASGPAGSDESVCYNDPGRELWIKGTVKF